MLKHREPETGFPDLWGLRGYWGACFERDPNINEYGVPVDDWDELGQDQQRDIAHEHGDDWHGQPPPAQDDDGGGSSQSASPKTSTPPAIPNFRTDAEREDWLADQRQRQWDEQERERKQNVDKGRKDWEEQVREREERLREEGRHDDADRLRDEREAQREQWDQEHAASQDARDQERRDYTDRPSIDRDTRIQQFQDADTIPERRKMREALADIHSQSSAADIEQQLWHNWAWEDAPPPPSAGRIAAATGSGAIPLFSESLDPMEKLGWETGEEYLERVEAVQAMRDQLSQERRLRESRGEQQFPGESDADFQARRASMWQGPPEAPQSALGYALEQLNAQGLGLAEYAAALERLSRDPWFHGIAYDQERDWLADKAGFYRSVDHAIAIGQTGTGEDLDAAIEALERLSSQSGITSHQLEYLDQAINSHERARETVTAARESAIEAWESKALGNINAFGDPDAKARARAILDDEALKGEERWDALAKIEAQAIAGTAHQANLAAWEVKVLGNINAFGDPDAKARAQAVLDDEALTGEERWDALAKIESQAWEGAVLGNIDAFGSPEAQARAEAVLADGALTGQERRDALAKIEAQAWEGKVLGNINAFGDPDAKARAQLVLDDEALTGEERWDALAKIESQAWEGAVLGNINTFGSPEAKAEAEAVLGDVALTGQERRDALAKIESRAWEYIEKRDRDLAISLGWDPHARGGRPELTPWEYIEQRNEKAEREARDLAESLGWDPDARGGRPELTPWEYIEQHNEEVEARARNWRESQRQLEALDELEPERLAQETLQRQQAAQFREDMFSELGSRGVSDEELADLTPGQLDAALAATADDLTREYQEWRESQRQLEALDELEPERLAQETLQRSELHAALQALFAHSGGDEIALDESGQAARAAAIWQRPGDWPQALRDAYQAGGWAGLRGILTDDEIDARKAALSAELYGEGVTPADWWDDRTGDLALDLPELGEAGIDASPGNIDKLDDSALALWEAGLQAPGDEEAAQAFLADSSHILARSGESLPEDLNELSPGQLEKAVRIASGELIPAVHVNEIALDPMEPFDREYFEQALLRSRHDPELQRQVRDYARGYGLYALALPESEMNARRLRLLQVMAYAAPIPGLGLGKAASFVVRPVARAAGPALSSVTRPALRLLRPGASQAVPVVTKVADDAVPALARNVDEFTRLLDAGKTRQAGRYMLRNETFKDWAVAGGLAPADIRKAGLARFLQETAALPPNILQRALGHRAFNVAAQAGRSALVGAGLSGGISTGLAVLPSSYDPLSVVDQRLPDDILEQSYGGDLIVREGWADINRDEVKGLLDSLWQGAAGAGLGNLSLRRANAIRSAAGKAPLGRTGQYKLAAVEGAGTDTALSLVPSFQDPTFGRINRNEQLGIALSTVTAPAFDAARGIAGLARHPRSLFPSTVSATGLRGGTQKFHYSQVAAGDDVELREVGSLADDGITPISTLQPEASIRREIERRLSVHPQRIRPGDESGLDYDKILSQGLDPVSGLRLREDVLDALARGETDIRGVTPSGIPYRFTPPAAYRTGVFAPGAAAHLSPDASFAIRARGDAPGSTFTTRSTNPSTVEEVLYLQPGAMAPRYFEGSASGNTGADATRESLRETAAGFAGLPNFARIAMGLPPVRPAALVLTPEEVRLLTARNVVEDGPDELPSKSFPGASDTKGRDPLPAEVFGSKGAEAEVVIPLARDLAKRRIALHILGGGAVAVHPDLPDPGFRDVWGTNVVALSDLLPFGTRVGLRLDRSPEQLGKAREFFEDGGVRRNRDNTGRFEVDAVVGGVRYRIRTDDDPAVLLGKVRSGSGGDVTNVIIRDTETGSVRQGTAPDAAEVVVGRTRSPRDSRGPLRTRQEPEVDPRSIRTQADVVRATAARAGRADAGRVDSARVDAGRVDAARADAGRVDAARVDAGRVDTGRADAGRVDAARVDAGRVDSARADAGRVDTARADAGRVDSARADAGRVDSARADAGRVDSARADAGRVDTARADAGRVDIARADAGRVDAARADRVDASRVDAGRVDTPRARVQGTTAKRLIPPRKRGEEPREGPKKPRLPIRFPKTVRFQTVEEVEVDLETGDTTRTPVGNRPAESLRVVERGESPHTDQHYAGRITDVLTDEKGHPYIAQKAEYQGQRPRRIPKPSELGQGRIKRLLEELKAQGRDREAPPAPRSRGRRGGTGGGRVSPAPGPVQSGSKGRRGMTALERTRLKNFAPR